MKEVFRGLSGAGGESINTIDHRAGKRKISSFFIPSISDILFLSIFLFLALYAGVWLLGDGDTGYHIRAGEYILKTLSVPRHDIFSFRSPALPWTAHEWLSEVIMALIYKVSGLTGVVLFYAFLIAFTYYLLFKVVRTYQGDYVTKILIIILAIASSQIHWLARPHIFSLLLLVIWYYLLDLYQYRHRNYLYLLPLIMLAWVNLHGGYIVGVGLVGIYLLDNLIKMFGAEGAEKKIYTRKTAVLGMTGAACLVVSLINPYGYHILLFPFKLTSNKFIMDNVNEFLSVNFHEAIEFKYMFFFMLAVFALSKKGLNFVELMLMLLFTYMALYSARYIPLFGIITAPILATQTGLLFDQRNGRLARFFKERASRIARVDYSARGFLWPFAAVMLVVILLAGHKIHYGFDGKIKAVAAVDFLKKEHLKGHVFNNDEFGDYLIYAAWPEYKVFFDGRSDMYGVKNMKEYFKLTRLEPGWQDVLKKYDINWIFYNTGSALSTFLLQRPEWKLIYADKVADIFVRNIPQNREWIERYKDVKPVVSK